MTLSISALIETRSKMTPGTWTLDDDTPCIYVGEVEVVVLGDEADNYDGDGPGLVATHNAADVLLEIAAAMMDRFDALDAIDNATEQLHAEHHDALLDANRRLRALRDRISK